VSCDKPRSRSTREHWLAYLIEGNLLVLLGAAAIVVPSWSVAIFWVGFFSSAVLSA
jgi:hypothetical protein